MKRLKAQACWPHIMKRTTKEEGDRRARAGACSGLYEHVNEYDVECLGDAWCCGASWECFGVTERRQKHRGQARENGQGNRILRESQNTAGQMIMSQTLLWHDAFMDTLSHRLSTKQLQNRDVTVTYACNPVPEAEEAVATERSAVRVCGTSIGCGPGSTSLTDSSSQCSLSLPLARALTPAGITRRDIVSLDQQTRRQTDTHCAYHCRTG